MDDSTADTTSPSEDLTSLTAVIFDEEDARRAEEDDVVVLPDSLLPGVANATMPLREGIRAGGLGLVALLLLLNMVEEFDRVALQVLGPDIQATLGISDTVLLGLQSLGGVVLVLSTLPFAWMADRSSRTKVLAGATGLWGLFAVATGSVVNSFQLGLARAGAGLGSAARIPIAPALVADQYPIGVRTRVFATEAWGRPAGQVVGPALAGLVVLIAGGGADAWRWSFWVLAIPAVILLLALLRQREPERGRNEREAVFGSDTTQVVADGPVRLSAAFQRLKKVKTFYFLVTGIGVLGFALVAVPSAFNLLLERAYGYDAFTRGWIGSITWAGALIAIPLAGRYGDRLFRHNPRSALVAMGLAIVGYGLAVTIGLRFQQPAILIAFLVMANAFQGAAFTQVGPDRLGRSCPTRCVPRPSP